MIIIEIIEESGLGALGGLLVLILVICLLANSCNGPVEATSDGVDYVETVETVATIPDVAELTSLHVLSSHSKVLGDNIRSGAVTDPYGKEYKGPYFALTSVYHMYDGWQEAYTELVTGGNYEILTGTFFADADYDAYAITFRIYADDTLIYDSGAITRRAEPIDFSVSISKANVIKIAATASNIDSTMQAAHIILTNAEVHK